MVERFREVVFLEKLQGQGSQGVSAEDPQRSTIGCFWWRFGTRHSFPDSISSATALSRSWVRSLGEVVSVAPPSRRRGKLDRENSRRHLSDVGGFFAF